MKYVLPNVWTFLNVKPAEKQNLLEPIEEGRSRALVVNVPFDIFNCYTV